MFAFHARVGDGDRFEVELVLAVSDEARLPTDFVHDEVEVARNARGQILHNQAPTDFAVFGQHQKSIAWP